MKAARTGGSMVDQLDDSKAVIKVVRSVAKMVYPTVDWLVDSKVGN